MRERKSHEDRIITVLDTKRIGPEAVVSDRTRSGNDAVWFAKEALGTRRRGDRPKAAEIPKWATKTIGSLPSARDV